MKAFPRSLFGIDKSLNSVSETALNLLLPVHGLLLVLGAQAVVALGGLQVKETALVGLFRGPRDRAPFAHTSHLNVKDPCKKCGVDRSVKLSVRLSDNQVKSHGSIIWK